MTNAWHLRDEALGEWANGRYYEAHEILEDFAECFDDDEPGFEWALALTRVAACLHKVSAGVGVKAVPGKLEAAIASLAEAPGDWCGIDVARLREELDRFAERIEGLSSGAVVPADLEYPVPRTVATKFQGG